MIFLLSLHSILILVQYFKRWLNATILNLCMFCIPLLPMDRIVDLPSICHIDGLVQDYSISSTLAMEILRSCAKPSICSSLVLTQTLQTSSCHCNKETFVRCHIPLNWVCLYLFCQMLRYRDVGFYQKSKHIIYSKPVIGMYWSSW